MDDGNKTSSDQSSATSYFTCYTSPFTCGGGLEDSLPDTDDLSVHTNTSVSAKLQAAAKIKTQYIHVASANSTNIMRRASVSRRAEHLTSPRPRSRSQENLQMFADEEEDRLVAAAAQDGHAGVTLDSLRIDADHVDANGRPFQDSVRSSGSGSGGFHRRAMSDPFDAQEILEEGAVLDSQIVASKRGVCLATLPRYPVQQQRNKNCWSEPQVSIFQVRGPIYLTDKKKIQSGPYLLPARGADLFLTDTPVDYTQPSKSEIVLGGQLRKFPTVVINFQFPWGNMLLYYEIPVKLTRYLTETPVALDPSLTAPETTLANWLMGDEAYRNDRLKLIPYVAEGPWIVRSMVTGKPALIGKKLPVRYNVTPADAATGHAAVLECTLDIGSSSATAKRIVSVCRRYMSALTVDIGFVIQGDTAGELPEQMMGSIRIHGVDPLQAPKLS